MKAVVLQRPADVVDFAAAEAILVGQSKPTVQRFHVGVAKEAIAVVFIKIEPRPYTGECPRIRA